MNMDALIKQNILDVTNDFTNFFTEKEFVVQSNGQIITAIKGNMKASLKHNDPSEILIYPLMPYDLHIWLPNEINYWIKFERNTVKDGKTLLLQYAGKTDLIKYFSSMREILVFIFKDVPLMSK